MSENKLAVWTGVIAAYVSASLVQILICGFAASSPTIGPTTSPVNRWILGLSYLVVLLAWLFGPAALATWYSVRKLHFWRAIGTERMTVPRSFALLLLPPLSIYLGIVVSINTWRV
jgi:hypothetical protein